MNPPTHSSKVAANVSDVWRRHIWLRPLIVLMVLASVGWIMRAKVEATLEAGGQVTATCLGTFVAVKEGHPAFHRW